MRYTVTEIKLLAIVKTLHEYKCILLGHLITIYTNHKNLTFLNFSTNCVACWWLIVELRNTVPILSTFPANTTSLLMLSIAYQNSMIRMMNQHSLKKSLHSKNKLTHFQLPSILFLKHNLPITKFNGALQTMMQTSKQE
jgi:hypothetical protein